MQITPAEIAETLAMVSKQHLDIRTITLGLNLRGCTDADIDVMARKVYDRMTATAVRLIPAIGKTVGDQLDFGGLLGYAPVMPVNPYAGTVFAHRGGRMPAPLNSLKN